MQTNEINWTYISVIFVFNAVNGPDFNFYNFGKLGNVPQTK